MLLARLAAALPHWMSGPLSAASAVAALAGTGCLFAAAVYGSYAWALWGLGAFIIGGVAWLVADHLAARR